MKKISKNNMIAIIIISALVVAFAIALAVLLINSRENRELYNNEYIRITYQEEILGDYSLQELLDKSSAVKFNAIYKPNQQEPVEKEYTGIYVKDLLEGLDIKLDTVNNVRFKAMDGWQQSYSINTILEEDNVYIAYFVNGKPFNKADNLISNDQQEEGGPFVVIRAKDETSQFRVKMLTEIIVE